MKVLIDADGCPVTDITVGLCEKYEIPCVIFCDTSHIFRNTNAEVVVVDKGANSVDLKIANQLAIGDIVITQDYGLASMCLTKCAAVLHQDGWEYTEENMDGLLFQRYTSDRMRARGERTHRYPKRKEDQNIAFSQKLEAILIRLSRDIPQADSL